MLYMKVMDECVADCGSLAYCVMFVSMFVSMFVLCVFALCQGLSPSFLMTVT